MKAFANFGSDAKKVQLTASFWHKDQAGGFDVITDDGNTGYAARKALVTHSRKVSMIGRLHKDMVAQQKYHLDSINIYFKLL